MKKLNLIALAAVALALGSCASEEPFGGAEALNGESTAPMAFNFHVTNQTRAADDFQDSHYQFGVWAYKGAEQTEFQVVPDEANDVLVANNVMNDYMVGYWNGTNKGYEPKAGQNPTTSWYYEGLGKNDVNGYTYHAKAGEDAIESHLANQYLKYWDGGKTYTYFYGYAPYTANVSFGVSDGTNPVSLTFPAISADNGADYMYAMTREKNAAHLSATQDYVDMKFYRLASKIRLAFYEELKGYDVELINYNQTADSGVVFVTSDQTANNSDVKYTSEATPVVKFKAITSTEDSYQAGKNDVDVTYTGATKVNTPFVWDVAVDDDTNCGFTALKLGDRDNKIYGDFKTVVPANAEDANCGFTLNVSFKLTAHGTGEEILVKGARVFVSDDYTQWKPNYQYTYVFRVTDSLNGHTDNPNPAISPEPNTNPALYPIIFDKIEVSEFAEDDVFDTDDDDVNDKEWNVQP